MNPNQTKRRITLKAVAIIAAHALVAWALCGAIVFVGRQVWTMETTLIIHAIWVPFVALFVSLIYFTYFAYTTPLQTATIFMLSPILMDLIVVATIIEKSYEMFSSLLGTWIPFALMFLTTYLTGTLVMRRKTKRAAPT
jgi:hypothetical protein